MGDFEDAVRKMMAEGIAQLWNTESILQDQLGGNQEHLEDAQEKYLRLFEQNFETYGDDQRNWPASDVDALVRIRNEIRTIEDSLLDLKVELAKLTEP